MKERTEETRQLLTVPSDVSSCALLSTLYCTGKFLSSPPHSFSNPAFSHSQCTYFSVLEILCISDCGKLAIQLLETCEWHWNVRTKIWHSQEHVMFTENWKVIDLGRLKNAVFELCQQSDTLIFDGIFFQCFQGSDAPRYKWYCWLILREWKLCKWQGGGKKLRSLDISVWNCVLKF